MDGSIPLKDNGIYCMVAGEPIVDYIRKAAEGAEHYRYRLELRAGGVAAAGVNPTGAVSLQEVLPGKTVINIPGCLRTPHNFLATVAHIITYGKPPKLDGQKPSDFRLWSSDSRTLGQCRPHFDAGRFAKEFGDEGHREGWCLYHLGCKGPETYGNCSTLQFCDVGGVWPVAIGHPCYGCNEEGIGFHKGIHQLANVENQTPRSQKPDVNAKEGGNVSAGAIGLLGGVVGLVAGVSVMAVRELGRQQKKDNADSRGE
ncbi:hydrogenase small subunit [Escherichia coli]